MGAKQEQPSAQVNIAAGSGCGCGCFGALIMFTAAIILAGMPLGFYTTAAYTQATVAGGFGMVVGLCTALLGVTLYAGSFYLEYREEQAKIEAWKRANPGKY